MLACGSFVRVVSGDLHDDGVQMLDAGRIDSGGVRGIDVALLRADARLGWRREIELQRQVVACGKCEAVATAAGDEQRRMRSVRGRGLTRRFSKVAKGELLLADSLVQTFSSTSAVAWTSCSQRSRVVPKTSKSSL